VKHSKYIKREDVDQLNEYLAERHEHRAAAKAGLPIVMLFYIGLGCGLKWLLGDVFFDGNYFIYGGLGVAVLCLLAVGIDFGTRVD
jgi:hypothetical protein